jgi:hypothetical protein
MTGLIHDVLDFARSRLGGGLGVTRVLDADVGAVIEEVITEMRTARPERTIDSEVTAMRPVLCDRARIGQLLSNLLANALTHGDPAAPVLGARALRRRDIRAVGRQQGASHPAGHRRPVVSTICAGPPSTGSRRPRTRSLHRLGDRSFPRRIGGRHVLDRGDPIHLPHAGGVARLLVPLVVAPVPKPLGNSPGFTNRRAPSGDGSACAKDTLANALLVDRYSYWSKAQTRSQRI